MPRIPAPSPALAFPDKTPRATVQRSSRPRRYRFRRNFLKRSLRSCSLACRFSNMGLACSHDWPMKHQRGCSLEKIPQPGEFNDLLGGQNSADQFSLRSGVDLVQMTQRCGFGHELPYALVQRAIRNEVGTRVADALVFA